jgi:hypothetical protein
VAILIEIMKWIKWEEGLDAFIMWVYGPAGAGKSAIAQAIAEMCDEEMILLASFFFSRNDPSRNTVKPFIATIVYQIILNLMFEMLFWRPSHATHLSSPNLSRSKLNP